MITKSCKRCHGLEYYTIWNFGLSKNGTFIPAKRNPETARYDNGRFTSRPCLKCNPMGKIEIVYEGPDYLSVPVFVENESCL